MGGPKYDLIVENNEVKDEFSREPQQLAAVPVMTAWWKTLLCNLLAAFVGAGLTLVATRGFSVPQTSDKTSTAVAQPVHDLAVSAVTATITETATETAIQTTTAIATSTKTMLLDPTLPTGIAADAEIIKTIPDPLAGNPLSGQVLDCGSTPAEAREKGCVYDVMMQDWVPEPCYDAVLTERYLAQGNWTWYANAEGTKILSNEEMAKGEHGQAWMSTSYHKAHCVFSWMKIIRALRNSRGISQELLSYDHVLHCSHGALKENIEPGKEDIGVRAPTNYAKCALYEDWKKDFVPDAHDPTDK